MTVLPTLNPMPRSRSRSRSRSRTDKETDIRERDSDDACAASIVTTNPTDRTHCTSSVSRSTPPSTNCNDTIPTLPTRPVSSTVTYLTAASSQSKFEANATNIMHANRNQNHNHNQNAPEHNNPMHEANDERRAFHFSIENDQELQTIIHNDIHSEDDTYILQDIAPLNANEFTSGYVLSKLYNYMKISEMSKYGIHVFEMTFSSYLPYLTECDLMQLATSYWCNGQHFKCMISHRGERVKSNATFQLEITSDLLDTAMSSGASVDKIEAMLQQKRIDDGYDLRRKKPKKHKTIYHHTKYERNFYLRNLHHRFWNHEVLVRVFIQNGWMTPDLAHDAIRIFIKNVYHRVLQSKFALIHNQRQKRKGGFSENFLHSFFVSYFCLDDIPKMYKNEIMDKQKSMHYRDSDAMHLISEETLRRWCELIELLASRGAHINEYEFRKIIPLQYALSLGRNTFKIISCSHKMKNKELIPQSYHQQNIIIPDDIWDMTIAYL